MHPTVDLNRLFEPIRPDLAQATQLLQARLAAAGEPLAPRLRAVVRGGKRLRPALVFLCGRALGAAGRPFLNLAAALDMLHAATLIHDDLVDGAGLRRGHETLHTVWPAGAAVLAGDYLLADSTALLAELGRSQVLEVYAGTLRAMCLGEIAEALTSAAPKGRAAYYRAIEAKTARLFAASAEMAALLAGGSAVQVAALRRFGLELGLAFQIVDDVLDLTADEASLGKPAASDLRQGLATLPILCYLERTAGAGDPVRAVLGGERGEEALQAAVAAIRASEAIKEALAEARAHTVQARAALDALPESLYRKALGEMAGYVAAQGVGDAEGR